MKLSELIAAYGDDKVTFQKMDDCASDIDWSAKKGTRATILTDEPVDFNGFKSLGLIVWLDRDRVAEVIGAAKAGKE